MVSPRTIGRTSGISLLEVMIGLAILAFGLLGLAAMQIQAMGSSAKGRGLGRAAEIAKEQMERVQMLPWAQVAPTGGFVAPGWIAYAGYAAGEVPVTADLPNQPGGAVEQVYAVRWQVADANAVGTLRDVDVRVQWTEAGGRARNYTLSTTRAR
jgi:Tfp pilus assembly protein PilV